MRKSGNYCKTYKPVIDYCAPHIDEDCSQIYLPRAISLKIKNWKNLNFVQKHALIEDNAKLSITFELYKTLLEEILQLEENLRLHNADLEHYEQLKEILSDKMRTVTGIEDNFCFSPALVEYFRRYSCENTGDHVIDITKLKEIEEELAQCEKK